MDTIQPFLANHHYNIARRQVDKIAQAVKHAADRKVIEALRTQAESDLAALAAESGADDAQKRELLSFRGAAEAEAFAAYQERLKQLRLPAMQLTDGLLKKLFPKAKKLKLPQADVQPGGSLTYWGWTDTATSKYHLVYGHNGRLIGMMGTFSAAKSHHVCAICKSPQAPDAIGFLSIVCKPPAQASADYYKAVGNYICLDAAACNSQLTEPDYLDYLAEQANTKWIDVG